MTEAFRDAVQREFAFVFADSGARLIESEQSASFDDAVIYLGSDRCRVRVTRDRGQVFADFAPPDGPASWFDAPLLLQHLGQEAAAAAHVSDGQRSLAALAHLVRPLYNDIAALFAPGVRAATIIDLTALRTDNDRRRWG